MKTSLILSAFLTALATAAPAVDMVDDPSLAITARDVTTWQAFKRNTNSLIGRSHDDEDGDVQPNNYLELDLQRRTNGSPAGGAGDVSSSDSDDDRPHERRSIERRGDDDDSDSDDDAVIPYDDQSGGPM